MGAAGLGDIGKHYSDQDSKHENRNSREFVVDIANKIQAQQLSVANVDATVILQSPKIASYIDKMRQNIADDLKLNADAVNIKATTTERMGFVGREEGIAAMAVVLLQ